MPARPELYSHRLQVRISIELMEKLKTKAKAKGITASEMTRRLILNYLEGLNGFPLNIGNKEIKNGVG